MDSLDWGLWIATLAVVIGVALELIEDASKVKEKLEWHERRPWRPMVPKIGSVILVLGLAFEIAFQTKIAQRDTAFRTSAETRIAMLKQEASNAEKSAANARLEAAKIEKSVAWRRLTPERATKIASSLKQFAGQRVNVFTYLGDLEAWMFASQIELALGGKDGAGWNVHFGRIVFSRLTFSGILIETTPNATEKDRKVAKVLLDTLSPEGAFPLPKQIPEGEDLKGETVEGDVDSKAFVSLTIGTHPAPPFTSEGQ